MMKLTSLIRAADDRDSWNHIIQSANLTTKKRGHDEGDVIILTHRHEEHLKIIFSCGLFDDLVVACFIDFAFCRRDNVLTIEYSMNAPNTKTKQVAIQMSMAFVNDPAGMLRSRPELCVVIVRIVRILREVLAGADSRSIQKDSHDNRTTRKLGR